MSSSGKYLFVSLGLCLLTAPAFGQQTPVVKKDAQAKPAPPGIPDPKFRHKMPEGAKQLKPMFLDKGLFQADKWWKYEEADDDRPFAHSVEQQGSVGFGAPLEEKHGAFVRYRVLQMENAEKAHQSYGKIAAVKQTPANIQRKVRPLKNGEEGIEVRDEVKDNKGVVVRQTRAAFIRFDRYIVIVESRADMRAFGSRPRSGQRKWMSDPVFDKVLQATLERWSNYRVLLADVK